MTINICVKLEIKTTIIRFYSIVLDTIIVHVYFIVSIEYTESIIENERKNLFI